MSGFCSPSMKAARVSALLRPIFQESKRHFNCNYKTHLGHIGFFLVRLPPLLHLLKCGMWRMDGLELCGILGCLDVNCFLHTF